MLIWEKIPQDTAGTLYRCKVPNGWLVKEVHDTHVNMGDGSNTLNHHGYEWTSSLTFVPDSNHRWDISKPIETTKTKEEILNNLIAKIPDDLLTDYVLEETMNGEGSKKLKKYVLNNYNGGELHMLLNHFNLINLNIN